MAGPYDLNNMGQSFEIIERIRCVPLNPVLAELRLQFHELLGSSRLDTCKGNC